MSYKIIINDEDFSWNVLEIETNLIIEKFFFEEDAEEYCNFLNRGGAFNGWTPAFLTIVPSKKEDINKKFKEVFY